MYTCNLSTCMSVSRYMYVYVPSIYVYVYTRHMYVYV